MACFRGAWIEDDLLLWARVWEGEGGGREGEEEDEGLGQVGELHGFAKVVFRVVWIEKGALMEMVVLLSERSIELASGGWGNDGLYRRVIECFEKL